MLSRLIVRLKSESEEPVLEPLLEGTTQAFFHFTTISHRVRKGEEKEGKVRTQFIPGALPPKLKVDGTTGTVNL